VLLSQDHEEDVCLGVVAIDSVETPSADCNALIEGVTRRAAAATARSLKNLRDLADEVDFSSCASWLELATDGDDDTIGEMTVDAHYAAARRRR
jgi:hypothetical protein